MNAFTKIALLIAFSYSGIIAATLDNSINQIEKRNDKLNTMQKSINKSEDKRENLLSEYKYVNQSLKNTKTYNSQLENVLESQKKELSDINQQIKEIDETKKNIYPLMKDMIFSLETLVKEDKPFLLKERQARIKRLKRALDAGDIKTHEKYRIILEAYKIEYDYSKTIESYKESINDITYNVLRLGRVALYTQSLDLKEYSYFNNENKTWVKITKSSDKSNIRKAIKIAKKQENVDLLTLPFLALKDIK